MRSMAICFVSLVLCWGCNGNGDILDRTDPGACEVHKCRLQEGLVLIRYGLIQFTIDEMDAQGKLFPHANSYYLGGCAMPVEGPRQARVSFCPECRKTEATWCKAHARKGETVDH